MQSWSAPALLLLLVDDLSTVLPLPSRILPDHPSPVHNRLARCSKARCNSRITSRIQAQNSQMPKVSRTTVSSRPISLSSRSLRLLDRRHRPPASAQSRSTRSAYRKSLPVYTRPSWCWHMERSSLTLIHEVCRPLASMVPVLTFWHRMIRTYTTPEASVARLTH